MAELEWMTAPHKVENMRLFPAEAEDEFGWWRGKARIEEDLEESLAAVTKVCIESHYDGLLGFSQGAALAALLCLLQHQGRLNTHLTFSIIVSGYISHQHKSWFQETIISTPSLHIIGKKDSILWAVRSRELAARFLSPRVSLHPGGHYLPWTGDVKRDVLAFLDERKREIESVQYETQSC